MPVGEVFVSALAKKLADMLGDATLAFTKRDATRRAAYDAYAALRRIEDSLERIGEILDEMGKGVRDDMGNLLYLPLLPSELDRWVLAIGDLQICRVPMGGLVESLKYISLQTFLSMVFAALRRQKF
jgi:hypothetical protein